MWDLGSCSSSLTNIVQIELYEPNFLVVGTRGRNLNGLQGLLPGSVSKWCVQNSPIPVVVARKESKRKKAKAARQADPSRRSYHALLAATGGHSSTSNLLGSHGHGSLTPENGVNKTIPNLDGNSTAVTSLSLLANSQTEAEAVARAIGIPTEYSASTILNRRSSRAAVTSATSTVNSDASEGLALRQEASGRSEENEMESPSPTGPLEDNEYFSGDTGGSDADKSGQDENAASAATNGGSSGMIVPELRLERQATDLDSEHEGNL